MYHHNVKLSLKSFASTLLAVLLSAVAVSTQTTSPTFPRRPAINRADRATINARAPAAIDGTAANRQRPTVRDMIFEEPPPPERENPGRRIDKAERPAQQRVNPDRDNLTTIPHWSDTFTYHGLTYKQTMVGTDPRHGSATTIIPTVIIPLRIISVRGVEDPTTDLIDGENQINEIRNSPIFQPTQINIGGISMGNTQYGDAFQRANFWDSVSRNSPDYHVLLDQPTVLPVYEVNVPLGPAACFQDETIAAVRNANLPAGTLAIVLLGGFPSNFCPRSFHGAYDGPNGVQTYIGTSYDRQPPLYFDPDCQMDYVCPHIPDYHPTLRVGAFNLSRQVLNWLNDPFLDSATPGYNFQAGASDTDNCSPSYQSADLMEPASIFDAVPWGRDSVTTNNLTHQMWAGGFRDYFTRSSTSRSVNGFYTSVGGVPGGRPDGPSPPCVGTLELDKTVVEYPDAYWTRASGINNKGWIVGNFYDWSVRQHGYIFDGRQYTQIDYPGARRTIANGINDAGQVVGIYFNATGPPHGFLYHQGRFTPVDFPGASDTYPRGINNAGTIVGMYDATQEITHGFIYENGAYRTLDTPFGLQTDPAAINDRGEIVGMAWDENGIWPTSAFRYDSNGFELIPRLLGPPWEIMNYPRAVNNLGMLGGIGAAARGNGFVTIYGYPYGVIGDGVYGINDHGQIVGNDFDDETQRYSGFVATLPK